MHQQWWCPCCGAERNLCTCTEADKDRHSKEMELDQARRTVLRLERELGLAPGQEPGTPAGNRKERRVQRAMARRR